MLIELRSQKLEDEKKMSCCSDVMKPIEASSCCTLQDTAAHAARAIRDSGCGCAPVVEDTENLKLVGVVTERDVCCSLVADDRHASEVRVEEIMRRSLWTRRAVAAAQSACTVWRGRRKRGAITQEVIDILAVLNARCGPHFL
ncbi:MAG: CBS domain-containing protein [Gemmatimonadaceae bacterium]|nr:CBS domain-containing protein [Gemmatimonadaceae bacterium]